MEENQNKNVGIEEALPETRARKAVISKHFSTKKLAMMGIFTALSFVLYMYAKFPMPALFPHFLDFQFSDMPALIITFIFGPIEGAIIVLCKILIKLPFSTTFCIGELADLMIGLAFVLPTGIIYRKIMGKKGVVLGLLVGIICTTAVAIFANRFILVPFYANLFGGMENVVKSVGKLYKGVTIESFYSFYLWIGVLPFNLLRGTISAILTFIIYGYLEKALKHLFYTQKSTE